jgi:Putative transposase/Transposase zinc-binding domain
VCLHPHPAEQWGAAGPVFTVADIFRTHGPDYDRAHALPPLVARVLRDVIACRTAALGGHLEVCDHCGLEHPAYNSCRNRHCPTCQALRQARWIEERKARILPVHYFHVVFTLPDELRPVALVNPKVVLDLLFDAASRTLLDLGRDPDRLGGTLGLTAVLHTWARDMGYHPHLHCIVTGGALSADGSRWAAARGRFLFPVAVMGALFRGKFLAGLDAAWRAKKLSLAGSAADLDAPGAFEHLRDRLYRKRWVVFSKRPFGGPEQVIRYLGRYTHRVAISSGRLLDVTDDSVTFRTRGDGTVTLAPDEFIRRFLLHVLPPEFRKIRHYGILSPAGVRSLLPRARTLLGQADVPAPLDPVPDDEPWEDLVEHLAAPEARLCPACKVGHLVRRRALPPIREHLPPMPLDTS